MPKYPDAQVQLSGEDGNAGAIMNRCTRALKDCGAPPEDITKFRSECLGGDYNALLRTCMKWVDVL